MTKGGRGDFHPRRVADIGHDRLGQALGQGFGVGEEVLDGGAGQAGALGDAFRLLAGDEVAGAVGVGIDDEGGAHFQGGPGHVAVGQAVAFAGRDFQEDAALFGQGRIFRGDEAGVGQDVDVGLEGGPLVPGATGSARVSPWMTMSGTPRARAWAVSGPMRAGGRWVNSRPGMR